MLVLVQAAGSAHVGVFGAVLAFGVIVAIFGHIIKSRTLIVAGLLVIALVSAYFSFVLQPTSG